jgi:hypothetical protein
MVYAFAGYELDVDRFELRRDGSAVPGRAPGVRRAALPGRASRPRGHEERVARQHLGRPLRQRVGAHQPDQGGPTGARGRRARNRVSSARRTGAATGSPRPSRTSVGTRSRTPVRDRATSDVTDHRPTPRIARRAITGSTRVTGHRLAAHRTEPEVETIAAWSTDPTAAGWCSSARPASARPASPRSSWPSPPQPACPPHAPPGTPRPGRARSPRFAHLVPADADRAYRARPKLDRATLFHRARAALDADGPASRAVRRRRRPARRVVAGAAVVADRPTAPCSPCSPCATARARRRPSNSWSRTATSHTSRSAPLSSEADRDAAAPRALGGPLVADTMRQLSTRRSGTRASCASSWSRHDPLER